MAAFGIRTKQIALARVADYAATILTASTFAEATGIGEWDGTTKAEDERLGQAIEEMIGRLHAIVDRNAPGGERHGRSTASG